VTRFVARVCAPVDVASLVALRVMLGVLLFVAVVRFWTLGWIDELYVAPPELLPYPGFAWLPRLPSAALHAVFAVMGACAILIALGRCYRVAAIGLLLSFGYVELLDATNYLNHYWLVTLLLFGAVIAPLGRPRTHVPAWMVGLVRAQLGLVYFFAGLAKLDADWLVHAQPLRLWLPVHADVAIVGPWLATPAVAHALAIAGAIFDLAIFPALCWSRTRKWAWAVLVVFHLATAALFPIGIFPWLMIIATTIFFAPDWPRRLLRRPALDAAATFIPHGKRAFAGALALGLFVGMQIAMPLRAPSDVGWHGQGDRFAWRVMIVEKTGFLSYRVVDEASGRSWSVDPGQTLTRRQLAMLAVQPDLILAYAHRIAQRTGLPGVHVYADSFVAYDGRPSARMVDPTADLAAIDDGFARWPWVLPAPTDPPP
jgi:vitamin K-dependent gamma-carboxylase